MLSLRAHYNGSAIVLDEPATLQPGQRLRVIVEPPADDPADPPRRSIRGAARGMFEMGDDFNDPLPDFTEYRR